MEIAIKRDDYPSLIKTTMDTMIIDEKALNYKTKIGEGSESVVYSPDDKNAIKVFKLDKKKWLKNKYKKIELLSELQDESFEFAKALACDEDGRLFGTVTNKITSPERLKTYHNLLYLKDNILTTNLLIKAEEAIKRIHEQCSDEKIILGDIKTDNILINEENNPVFIDTDNYHYNSLEFDVVPAVVKLYENLYNCCSIGIDNDKFSFALMALQIYLCDSSIYRAASPCCYEALVDLLEISNEAKEKLNHIFSDKSDKPYIGEILSEFCKDKIISNENREKISKVF